MTTRNKDCCIFAVSVEAGDNIRELLRIAEHRFMLLKEWHYFFIFVRHSPVFKLGHQTGNGRHFEFETCSMEMIQRQQRFNRMVTGREQFPVIGRQITFVRGDHQNFMFTAIRFWIVHAIKIRDRTGILAKRIF